MPRSIMTTARCEKAALGCREAMALFAGKLKEREIEALAAYYQQAHPYPLAGQPKN